NSVLLSGVIGGKPRVSLRVSVAGASSPQPPTGVLTLRDGDRAVQLADSGDIYGVRQSDGAFSLLERQPELAQRKSVASITPNHGWWRTGTDPGSGAPSVAVSRDQGRQWTVRALDVPAGQLDVPTLASYDGVTAYAFVRYSTGIRHFRTRDGGKSWSAIT